MRFAATNKALDSFEIPLPQPSRPMPPIQDINPHAPMSSMLTSAPPRPPTSPPSSRFIRELAIYEREPDAVVATEADLLRDGLGPVPRFTAVIAEYEWRSPPASRSTSPATPPGAATTASASKTSTSRRRCAARASAKRCSRMLARIAVEQGCPRLEWDVLEWNAPAIAVYERMGARMLTEWRIMRLAGELKALAEPSS